MNSAGQSIHGAPDTIVDDASMISISWGSGYDLRVEDRQTALGNQLVGLQTRWRRMHE